MSNNIIGLIIFEDNGKLYRKTNMGINLLLTIHEEAQEIINDAHKGEYGYT